jgi:hypothetical protein
MNDSISSITSQNIDIDEDYQASEDDVVATTMDSGNSLVNDNDSVASSRLFEDGIASLECYLDDMIFGEDSSIEDTTEEVINNVLLPDYVECLEAKELLQMLSENELPPLFKSQIAKLHPAEEELVIILRKNNLPISLYKELIDWAHRVSSSNYEFSSPTYKTALDRMKKKYLLEAGTAPLRSTIEVEGESFPPMHVYHFSVLHQVKRLLQSKELLEGALWRFKPKFCPDTNERVYQQLNSGEWWELAEHKMDHDLNLLGTAKPPGLHFILPIILFDDSTLCDNIGRLLAQPILCTIGTICDDLRRQVQSWFILGMVPPYPKSSKERESD